MVRMPSPFEPFVLARSTRRRTIVGAANIDTSSQLAAEREHFIGVESAGFGHDVTGAAQTCMKL